MIINRELGRLKALVIEDFENAGKVSTYYDKSKFQGLLNKYTEWEITKIFEPTESQNKDILTKMLEKAVANDKDGKGAIQTEILMIDMLLIVIPTLTDIKVDLSVEEDKEYIEGLIKEPTEVFRVVINILKDIITELFKGYVEKMDEFTESYNKLDNSQKKQVEKYINENMREEMDFLENTLLEEKEKDLLGE